MSTTTHSESQKRNLLYLLLACFFLGNAILAELREPRYSTSGNCLQEIFKGSTIPAFMYSMNMSIGVVIWPLVFITSDIMNEYFGRDGVRRISFITAAIIAYSSLFLITANKLPPADFWLKNNPVDPAGNPFNIRFCLQQHFQAGSQYHCRFTGCLPGEPAGGCIFLSLFQDENRAQVFMATGDRFNRYFPGDR